MTYDKTAVPPLAHLSDPELIARVRSGDSQAYEALFLRHREVAERLARRLSGPERADDICSEAFAKILDLLRRGGGPDVAFRAYLLATVRTVHLNGIRAGQRESAVADAELQSLTDPVDEDADARFDEGAIARAFRQLPERWQSALWMTAVEDRPNEEIGRQLGIQNNAVASLAFRARAGLRQAYLAEHLRETASAECTRIADLLPSFLRGTLTARRRQMVEAHLDRCSRCAVAAEEVADVDRRLGALLGPIVVGGAAAALWPATVSLPSAPAAAGALAGLGKGAGGSLLGSLTSGGIGAAKVALAAAAVISAVGVSTYSLTNSGQHPVNAAPPVPRPSALVLPPDRTSPLPGLPRIRVPAPPVGPDAGPRVADVTMPAADPSAAVVAVPPTPSSPSAAPPSSPSTAPAATLVLQPLAERKVAHDGRTWRRVSVAVTGPVRDAALLVTSTRTVEVALVTPTASGWLCEAPRWTWINQDILAATAIDCRYAGGGDGSPLQIDYRVGGKAAVRGQLTPPPGVQDPSTQDNAAALTLH